MPLKMCDDHGQQGCLQSYLLFLVSKSPFLDQNGHLEVQIEEQNVLRLLFLTTTFPPILINNLYCVFLS